MTLFEIASILGYVIGIAAIIGLVRFDQIIRAYQPFVIISILTSLNHILSLQLVKYTGSNAINGNIFVLIESVLYIWLFANWGIFKYKWALFIVLAILIITWTIDNFI